MLLMHFFFFTIPLHWRESVLHNTLCHKLVVKMIQNSENL